MGMLRHFAAAVCLMSLNLATANSQEAAPVAVSHLSDAAKPLVRPQSAPKRSDVCMSSRWSRPMTASDPYHTFRTAADFRATRFEWSAINEDCVTQAHKLGAWYVSCINSELDGNTNHEGRDKDVHGKIIGNPELTQLVARGDLASDEYPALAFEYCKRLIDMGVDGIQVDDPGMSYSNAVDLGGGYGDASLRKFNEYLAAHTTSDRRKEWGLPEDLSQFNYAEFVLANNEQPPAKLRETFLEFHRDLLDKFYKKLRKDVDAYAGRRVPFSCNNGSPNHQTDFNIAYFDYWVGEMGLHYGGISAKWIYDKTHNAEKLGKMQVFSPSNDSPEYIPTRAMYVDLTRKTIASSYACGTVTLVPWDVWRSRTHRFFGSAGEFGDLYRVVSEHPTWFDNHEEVYAAGPEIDSKHAEGLATPPVELVGSSGDVLVTVRAVPGQPQKPVVVHLVEWSDNPPSTWGIKLGNKMFGWPNDRPIELTLVVGGQPDSRVTGRLSKDWTEFNLPQLGPWCVLAVEPPESDGP